MSRILGLIREKLAASLFGDHNPVFDAFITAWRVPNLLRRFLGEGALSTAFQTALTEVDGDHGEQAGRRLFLDTARLLTGLLLLLTMVVVCLVALAPDELPLVGWRWLGKDPEYVRDLTVRVMPFVVLVCLTALATGALHVRGHFSSPAWAPAALNLVWIGTLVFIGLHFRSSTDVGVHDPARSLAMARVLAWGVLLAGLTQLLILIPALRRTGLLGKRIGSALLHNGPGRLGPGPLTVLRRSAPLALGAAVYQINVMTDGLMAEGLLPDGGPTCHYYANRLQQFPMALLAVAATSAVFPSLQALGHSKQLRAVRDLHDRTHRSILFLALPATAGLLVLAEPVIRVCLGGGEFGEQGVLRTTPALQALTLAIVPAGATGLLARTYYSLGDMKTPVRVSVLMLVANVLLNVLFVRGWGMDVDGLALATACTSWGSLVLLIPGLKNRIHLPPRQEAFLRPVGMMLLAAALCGAAAAGSQALLGSSPWVGSGGTTGALGLAASITVGAIAYGLSAHVFSLPEMRAMENRFRERFRR